MTPAIGYVLGDVTVVENGVTTVYPPTATFAFSNVIADGSITPSFVELPTGVVSGVVTDGTTGIGDAKVFFKTSENASVSAWTFATTLSDGSYTKTLPVGAWYVAAGAAGYDVSADQVVALTTAGATADFALVANPNWDVVFALNTDDFSSLADGDRITTWNCSIPDGKSMPAYETYNNGLPLLGPTVEIIDGVKWEQNVYGVYDDTVTPTIHARADGFRAGTYTADIPASGVTIVAVVKPKYVAIGGEPRGEIVDIFYQELYLAVNHGNGEVIVCTRGSVSHNTGYMIPDGQKTILSLVVQPTGGLVLYANGEQVWAYASGTDYTTIQRSWDDQMAVGRNAHDGWSTFSGNIGDVYVYKTAISDAKREALQSELSTKFGIVIPVFTTISGKVTLPDGITPIDNATVTATGTSGTTTANTAPNGTYSMSVVADITYDVSAAKDSYVASASQVVAVGTTPVADINFTMSLGYAIQGVVKTVGGTPIYNAVVQVGGPGYPAAVTDADGKYQVTGLSVVPDPANMEVYADALGYAGNTQTIDGTVATSGGVMTLDIALIAKVETGVIPNGGLESWTGGLPDGWQLFNGTSVTASPSANRFSGNYSAFVTATVEYNFLMVSVDVIPGSTYNCYFKLKGDVGVTQCFPMPAFRDNDGNEIMATVSSEPGHAGYVHAPDTNNWLQYLHFENVGMGMSSMPFVRILAPELATKMTVIFGFETLPPAGLGIYVDDVVIDRVGTDTLPPAPVAGFTADPLGGVRPLPVTFTDTSTGDGITDVEWNFGDSSPVEHTAWGLGATHTFTVEGTWTVTQTVTSPGGTGTITSDFTVTLPGQPTVATTTKSGTDIVLTGTSSNPAGYSYIVQASPSLKAPVWTTVKTDVFGAGGTFTTSIPIVPGEPIKFYRIQMP